MRIPFLNVQAQLALQSHMYICMQDTHPDYGFVKCQTLKPYMLNNAAFIHYVDEPANIGRNPFVKATRIDCDKLFASNSVEFNDSMKTTSRPDICQKLYDEVSKELSADGYTTILLNVDELLLLNSLISRKVLQQNNQGADNV